jgi:hypothetical protein
LVSCTKKNLATLPSSSSRHLRCNWQAQWQSPSLNPFQFQFNVLSQTWVAM